MFLQYLINGLTVGSIFALIAIGYSMIYSILRIVNFAHGDIFMVGTFISMTLIKQFGLPLYIAVPCAAMLTAILGILIEKFAYRPIRSADRLSTLISAIGVSIMLQNLALVIFGTSAHRFAPGFKNHIYVLFRSTNNTITISLIQIIILLTTAILLIALNIVVLKTKIGIAMRATSYSINSARLMGINTNQVIAFTFGIGSVLACVAGVLVGLQYDSVEPMMGYAYGLKAFASAVFGGIGSLPGATIGGFVIGIIEVFGAAYISNNYRNAFAFGIMILVLIFKPSGILGKSTREKV